MTAGRRIPTLADLFQPEASCPADLTWHSRCVSYMFVDEVAEQFETCSVMIHFVLLDAAPGAHFCVPLTINKEGQSTRRSFPDDSKVSCTRVSFLRYSCTAPYKVGLS